GGLHHRGTARPRPRRRARRAERELGPAQRPRQPRGVRRVLPRGRVPGDARRPQDLRCALMSPRMRLVPVALALLAPAPGPACALFSPRVRLVPGALAPPAAAAAPVGAQDGAGGASAIVLQLAPAPRPLALGGAYAALARDPYALFYNPGRLAGAPRAVAAAY